MRALLQRVSRCVVRVEGREVSGIARGLLVFLGVSRSDGQDDVRYLVNKLVNLRIFDDLEGKLNKSLLEVGGKMMVVSQFTLYADTRKGRRPSYVEAAEPERAEALYEAFCEELESAGIETERGVFGARMAVELENDGPVTIMLESPPSPSRHAP